MRQPAKPFEKYNIVLVFIDTLRADHLSCYGYHRKTSPNIDKLAKESFVFEQNFTPVTYTFPSFMSIITSLYPNSHAVLDVYKDKLSSRVKTLAQILQIYGYKTAWFGSLTDSQLSPEAGFGRGFDELYGYDGRPLLGQPRKILFDWLDRNKDKKFFLNFHTYNVHSPYIHSPKYKQRFTKIKSIEGIIDDEEQYYLGSVQQLMQDKKLATELIGEDLYNQFMAAGLLEGTRKQIEDFFISRKKLDKLLYRIRETAYWRGMNLQDNSVNAYVQALYDACILEFDEEVIGPVIAKLKALKLYDKTIIIICADHGEEFYEHNSINHGNTLYDEVTYVPLIIRIPWIKHGKHIKELSQTVDIMPTLLDLLEIPLPHQTQGKSLVSLIYNKKSPPAHEYIYGRTHGVSYIRSKDWLLVLYDNESRPKELYNLYSDPKEQHNIYLKNQAIAFKLESRLKAWEASLPSYKDQEYTFPPEIDKVTQERIKKTGYW